MTREPPSWPQYVDTLARQCDITTVSFGTPIPADAWCHYCGYQAQARDHIVPDSIGGAKSWWNLVPACHACNLSKADRQGCACLFCLRALALWHMGFRRTGASHRDRKNAKKQRAKARERNS